MRPDIAPGPGDPDSTPRPAAASPADPGHRRRLRVSLAVGAVVAVVVVVLLVGLIGGDDESRLQASGDVRGIPDVSPVGRLGGQAAIERLKRDMRPGDAVTSVSLTSFHAVAAVAGTDGHGRTLAIEDVPDGDVDTDDDGPGSAAGGIDAGLPLGRLDPAAPRRLLAAALRGIGPGVRPRVLEIKALSTIGSAGPDDTPAGDGLRWEISLGDREADTWTGDLHGRHVARRSDGAPAPAEGRAGPAVEPAGANASSLIAPSNLRRQLDELADRPEAMGGVSSLQLTPKKLTLNLRQPSGAPDAEGRLRVRERALSADAAGGVEVDARTRRRLRSQIVGVRLAAVDPEAPLRALQAIGRRVGGDATGGVLEVSFEVAGDEYGEAPTGWHLRVRDGQGISNWLTKPDGSGLRTDTYR
jgi:hypothetical protein